MGKKSGPAAPAPPDYQGAANATAAGNLDMARYQTEANRINQVNPYGSLTYSQGPNGQWTQTERYDPRVQGALDSQLNVQRGLSDQAGSMLGRVRDEYSTDFTAPRFNSYMSGVGGVDTSRLGSAGTFGSTAGVQGGIDTTGVNGVEQNGVGNMGNFRSGSRVATNENDWLVSPNGSDVNVNAPQFTKERQDEYAKAAYDSQMGLLRGDLNQQEERTNNRLALQGLTPGSEASDKALGSFYDGRSRQLDDLAARSVLTGNSMSNNDYSSQLAGFDAGNNAIGQRFSQGLQGWQAKNAAEGQRFNQDSSSFASNLQAKSLNNTLQQSRNAAQQQAFDQATTKGQFTNSANAQQFAQDQATYDANLRGLTTNATLQDAYNRAQQQQYGQAVQNYGTNWQEEQTLRNMPLNELNALMSGQQVQNPQYQNYGLQSYAGGADSLSAAQLQGQYNTNIYNQQMANRGSSLGAIGGLAGSLFGAAGQAGGFSNLFSDERLKDNVEKVGETPAGSNVYTWDWNAKAKKVGADKQPGLGFIAQEHPEAAVKGPRGYLMLDYRKAA